MKNLNPKILSYSLIILLGVFLLPKTAYLSSITDENIIILTNKERIKNGLDIVTANQVLSKAAYEKGLSILKTQTFQHDIDGRKFSSWIKDTGYEYSYAGENLAIDFATSEGVVNAWMESPTHKKNLLNTNFKEIGVAIIDGNFQNHNTSIVVQIFGTPLKNNLVKQTNTYQDLTLSTKNHASQNNGQVLAASSFSNNFQLENSLMHSINYYDYPSSQKNLNNSLVAILNKNYYSLFIIEFALFLSFLLLHSQKIKHQ